ncbi:stalk domain-containing protein [[Brevibacterium] frigoritolerans]|nr:stalk domain-containing protein [Peribacillus frigoritolerans]
MKKLLISLGLMVLAFFCLSIDAKAATSPVIYVDGKKISGSSITVNGTTLVPIREIAEKIGLEVLWNQSTQTVTFKHPYRKGIVTHKIGTKNITLNVNGVSKNKTLAAASVVRNGTSYLPIRLFESFDAQVYWSSSENRIDVYSYELKMSQYVMFSGLAYNKIDHLVGSSLSTIVSKLSSTGSTGLYRDLKKTQAYLGMYKITKSGITPSTLIGADYLYATEWKLIDKEINSATGFQGLAFQNNRTKEIVVAFRGSEEAVDWKHNGAALLIQYNKQKTYAYRLFSRNAGKSNNITVVGHSLGGYLAQATAINYPNNFDKVVTFNAFGNGKTSTTKKVMNYKIASDPVSAIHYHYGRSASFFIREYQDDFKFPAAHYLFNFYSYFYPAKTKYWLNLDKKGSMPHNDKHSTSSGNPFVW